MCEWISKWATKGRESCESTRRFGMNYYHRRDIWTIYFALLVRPWPSGLNKMKSWEQLEVLCCASDCHQKLRKDKVSSERRVHFSSSFAGKKKSSSFFLGRNFTESERRSLSNTYLEESQASTIFHWIATRNERSSQWMQFQIPEKTLLEKLFRGSAETSFWRLFYLCEGMEFLCAVNVNITPSSWKIAVSAKIMAFVAGLF